MKNLEFIGKTNELLNAMKQISKTGQGQMNSFRVQVVV